jgi:hypothetical protein
MQVLPVPYIQISDLYRRDHLVFPPDKKGSARVCGQIPDNPIICLRAEKGPGEKQMI